MTQRGRCIVNMTRANRAGLDDAVVIYHAQGIASVQAGCSLDAALALMQSTAEATDTTLFEVADGVLARQVTFYPPT